MSQGYVSDLTSEITAVTVPSQSENVSNNFTQIEDPKGQKCIHCKKSWRNLTATTMKAYLKFSKEYKINLCSFVPPNVSAAMVSKLQEVEGKKEKKRHFNDRITAEMNHEQAEIAKKQKGSIEDCFQTSASILADQKVANYVYVTN